MTYLALDIGGANLKLADGLGWARSVQFPLWREPDQLANVLSRQLAEAPAAERLVVTMTGELADCFRSKAEGVLHILSSVDQAAEGRRVQVYLTDGRLVTLKEASENPLLAAASNWHALARFACQMIDGKRGVLIDVGSTTTDLVPLDAGQPVPVASNDTERLLAGELVYTGVMRTPICAVAQWLPWRGRHCPVAAEVFATMADVHVILGEIEEQLESSCTADGRPLTIECARARLARSICADPEMLSNHDAKLAAVHLRDCQLAQIRSALSQVGLHLQQPPERFVLSGEGEFLARRAIATLSSTNEVVSLEEQWGKEVSACAPAHALGVLAREAKES